MKTCTKCGGEQSLTEFHVHRKAKDGLASWCKTCKSSKNAAWRAANPGYHQTYGAAYRFAHPERARASGAAYRSAEPERERARHAAYRSENRGLIRAEHLRRQYGLTAARYDVMLAAQGGGCAVCGTTVPGGRGAFHVDHDHACCPGRKSCGKCIRGLLCARHNTALGLLDDSVENLMSAAAYLLRSTDVLASMTA